MKALIARLENGRLRARADGARRRRVRGARRHPRPLCARARKRRCGSISSAIRWRSIRAFDVASQRTTGQRKAVALQADERGCADARDHQPLPPRLYRGVRRADRATMRSMRRSAKAGASPAWSTGCRFFYERLETLFDYLPDAPLVFDHLAREALGRAARADPRPLRGAQASRASRRAQGGGAVQAGARRSGSISSPDEVQLGPAGPRGDRAHAVRCARCRAGASCSMPAAKRRPQLCRGARRPVGQVFDAVVEHIADDARQAAASVVVAGWTRRLARPAGADPGRARTRQAEAGRDAGRCRAAGAGPGRAGRAADRGRLRDRRFRRRRRAGHSRRPAGPALEEAHAAPPISSRKRPRCRPATSSSTPITASAASSA